MSRWHDRSRLWITEFGWSTGGDPSAFRVSERGQADRISETLSALVAERSALRLRGFVLFKWRDSVPAVDATSDPWPLQAGLLDAAGQPKRGFWAFARVVEALRDGAKAGTGRTHVSLRPLRVSPLGFATVRLGCSSPQTGACGGRLNLRSTRTVRCGGEVLRSGFALGTSAFSVAVAPAMVPVRLRAVAARVIRCAGRIAVRVTTSRSAAASRSADLVLRRRQTP
jgi:hypothetical protein